MDLLRDDVRAIFARYLALSFGSTLIVSLYASADAAMVGHYEGPDGAAALAVVMPVWTILFSIGILIGTGGSVRFGALRGSEGSDHSASNSFFTLACSGCVVISLLIGAAIFLFDEPLLRAFGADGHVLQLAMRYMLPIKFVSPLFVLAQMLSAFLRNDGSPGLVTISVICGGISNVIGDWAFVFGLDLGAFGAGLATSIGCVITFLILLIHFARANCTLAFVRVRGVLSSAISIVATGFPAFFIDITVGIVTVLMNRQIIAWLDVDALAVYGALVNASMFVQCCAYSIGQAVQPLISRAYGAGERGRITEGVRCSLAAVAVCTALWTIASLAAPEIYVWIFMDPTPEILDRAPTMVRVWSLVYLFMPLNIFSTYYFQAVMLSRRAFFISVARGAVLSSAMIMLLPEIFGGASLWAAIPLAEAVVALPVAYMLARAARRMA